MADFNFLLPPGTGAVDGPSAYVRGLAAALTDAGHAVWFGDGPAGSIRVVAGRADTVPNDQLTHAVGLIDHSAAALAQAAEHGAKNAGERERLALLRRIVVTTEPTREWLVTEFAIDASKIDVVRPGVPDAPRCAGSGGPECTLLTIGSLVPRQGHAVLLSALARLFDLPWRLVLVGDAGQVPEHTAALHEQVAKAGCADRVRFAGTLEAAALEAEWHRADIFALATEWDEDSTPVAEALRRGLPVAVASGGQAAALVTPDVGVVCAPVDAVTLSKSLRRLIFDTDLRADMAEAAWQLGQTLPVWSTQAARFVEAATCS